jgi:hypothetical protein
LVGEEYMRWGREEPNGDGVKAAAGTAWFSGSRGFGFSGGGLAIVWRWEEVDARFFGRSLSKLASHRFDATIDCAHFFDFCYDLAFPVYFC